MRAGGELVTHGIFGRTNGKQNSILYAWLPDK